jgi:hypothetical protein
LRKEAVIQSKVRVDSPEQLIEETADAEALLVNIAFHETTTGRKLDD